MLSRTLGAMAIATGIASHALGGVTYTAQTRTIQAHAGFPAAHSALIAAPDFGLFDQMVDVAYDHTPPEQDSYGFASQRSMLTQDGIFFSGDCHGTDGYGSGGAGAGYGESILDVTFVYDGPATTWMINVSSISGIMSRTSVKFDRLAPTTVALIRDTGHFAWSSSGVMTAGTYRLQLEVVGGYSGSGTGSGGGPYGVTFAIPAPTTLGVLGVIALGAARRRRA